MTRVLLVDDDPLVRAGLAMVLSSSPEIEVVGEAGDGAQAVEAVRAHWPDVVLMDIRMPQLDGLAATEAVTALNPAPKVIVLTTFDLDDYVFKGTARGGQRLPAQGHPTARPRQRRTRRRCRRRDALRGGDSPVDRTLLSRGRRQSEACGAGEARRPHRA